MKILITHLSAHRGQQHRALESSTADWNRGSAATLVFGASSTMRDWARLAMLNVGSEGKGQLMFFLSMRAAMM
jgi:hypothetical protein